MKRPGDTSHHLNLRPRRALPSSLRASFCDDVVLLRSVGLRPVVVHGAVPPEEVEAEQKMKTGPGAWFVKTGCFVCHSIQALGVKSPAQIGPDLSTAVEDVQSPFGRTVDDFADFIKDESGPPPIDVAADHLPFFGTVRGKRIHYGLGYSGHGVGPSWLGGQVLASLALGLEDEWTALPLATRKVPSLPPEPLKRLGGGLVRSAILACEHAEEEGRRAPLPARLGAALPRLLGMQIGTR